MARGPGSGGLGALPPGFLPLAAAQGPAGGELRLVVGLLAGVALGGARIDLALGLGDGRQAVLAALELLGHAHPVGDVGAIRLLGQRQQFLDFRLEVRLDGLGVPIAQGAVTAGVGVDLGAVEADAAKAAQLVLAGDLEHLDKHRLELLAEALAKVGQGIVVGVTVAGNVMKGQRIVCCLLDLAAGVTAGGVAVDQQRQP